MLYNHQSYTVKSGTAGLQEALDYNATQPQGAVVILTPAWTQAGGLTGMISAAYGYTNVTILDERQATFQPYQWNGTQYVPVSIAGACGPNTPCTSLTASVNTQINVMAPPFNAKGDCSTDDQAALNACLRGADALAFGNSLPAVVDLPKPPGGCYKTSTLAWYGESIEGQALDTGTGGGVIIKGQPGEDILHVNDPTTATTPFYNGWELEHLSFEVDNTSAGSFPNRLPGRSFDDAGMTASSAILTSANGAVSCPDIGQAIQVNGAGSGGANLVTTISNVTNCWGLRPAAVAANHAYGRGFNDGIKRPCIYFGWQPSMYSTIGNCAIAFDDQQVIARIGPPPTVPDYKPTLLLV